MVLWVKLQYLQDVSNTLQQNGLDSSLGVYSKCAQSLVGFLCHTLCSIHTIIFTCLSLFPPKAKCFPEFGVFRGICQSLLSRFSSSPCCVHFTVKTVSHRHSLGVASFAVDLGNHSPSESSGPGPGPRSCPGFAQWCFYSWSGRPQAHCPVTGSDLADSIHPPSLDGDQGPHLHAGLPQTLSLGPAGNTIEGQSHFNSSKLPNTRYPHHLCFTEFSSFPFIPNQIYSPACSHTSVSQQNEINVCTTSRSVIKQGTDQKGH